MPAYPASATPRRIGPADKVVVVGFGLTGESVIRYLSGSTTELIAMDTRAFPPNKKSLQKHFPKVRLVTGGLDRHSLETADVIAVSPGVSVGSLDLEQLDIHARVLGDVELFAWANEVPVIAITGSNGKSTVASLVHAMLVAGGVRARLAGNIGKPVLDALSEDQALPRGKRAVCYVLELSSFQLETTHSLAPVASVILNVSEDHMDRYTNIEDYASAKRRVYMNAEHWLVSRDDPIASEAMPAGSISFGLTPPPDQAGFGLIDRAGEPWLAKGAQALCPARNVRLSGRANWANVLAALALIDAASSRLGLARLGDPASGEADQVFWRAVLDTVTHFSGLRHRCERVAEHEGVSWVNDSKGTNIGAALAAIASFPEPKILILGGQGKGADFQVLAEGLEGVKKVLLIGEDAALIAEAIAGQVDYEHVPSLDDAVARAAVLAKAGEVVLLSPACASFDMFSGYAERGDEFCRAVRAQLGEAAMLRRVENGTGGQNG